MQSHPEHDPAPIPASLVLDDLQPVWRAVRQQLDRRGPGHRGHITLPTIGSEATLALASLLDGRTGRRLDLAALENALVRRSIGTDLDHALTRLGAPPSEAAAEQRRRRQTRIAVRDAVATTLQAWPENWASDYGDWLLRSGQMTDRDDASARRMLEQVRYLIDEIAGADPGSFARTDLAVSLIGSSHALDDGVWLERCVRRALWHRSEDPGLDYRQCRTVWARAGVRTDRVSAPVLVWRLPLLPETALGALTHAAERASLPLHLSEYALHTQVLRFDAAEPVLLVENPRVIEAAAEREIPQAIVCTHGNPTGAVTTLVDAMLDAGVAVRCHADFDGAGIGICRRLAERGCTPWRMSADDYRRALRTAETAGIALPRDAAACGPTPWDPALESCLAEHGTVVHEELLLDELFAAM